MSRRPNILIVGQGFAGSLLAWNLVRKNIPVTVIDDDPEFNATKVAAGIIIPITGRRLAKTYLADQLLPFAFDTYREIEKNSERKLFFEMNVLQVFSSSSNLNEWYARSSEPGMEDYCDSIVSQDKMPNNVRNNYGGIVLKKCGYIDTLALTESIIEIVKEKGNYFKDRLDFNDLTPTGDSVKWNGNSYSHIIFCEGYQATLNPYFSFIPFKPAKGEIIDFITTGLTESFIISSGNIYILPLANGNFRAGATYEWNNLSEAVTSEGLNYLSTNLQKAIGSDFSITGHQAGIRPAMLDRRPCLGLHPKFQCIGIFNGLGTKGALLAPFYANEMASLILEGRPIDDDVNIRRFDRFCQEP